ncbi:MAG: hypothetical protein JWO24_2955 [Rhodospirillales bacterium]|nr:hypothetical protein [Rhodospirillales bacterium]
MTETILVIVSGLAIFNALLVIALVVTSPVHRP